VQGFGTRTNSNQNTLLQDKPTINPISNHNDQ
jgi:hypothetical protein